MKIHITPTPIGNRCREWAITNLPSGYELTDDMENCEILFSIFYNHLISKEFIAAKKKCFNFHGGLLPEYRGSGTINFAIINGEKETGVTLHEIDDKIDHGPVIAVEKIPILENDTAQTIYEKMEDSIIEIFKKWFVTLIKLEYKAIPQDHSQAKLYTRADLQKAKDLTPFARAYTFYEKEKAFYINRKGQKIYLDY